MKQKLAIAQAIMESPSLLLLDEPTNGLDNQSIDRIRNLLLEEKEAGKTILIASHNKEDIKVLCDVVFQMENGEISRLDNW
jgi:ABC-2 type transport system ATP-binding protein